MLAFTNRHELQSRDSPVQNLTRQRLELTKRLKTPLLTPNESRERSPLKNRHFMKTSRRAVFTKTPAGIAIATRVTQIKDVSCQQTVGSPVVRTLISAMSSTEAGNWRTGPLSARIGIFEKSNDSCRIVSQFKYHPVSNAQNLRHYDFPARVSRKYSVANTRVQRLTPPPHCRQRFQPLRANIPMSCLTTARITTTIWVYNFYQLAQPR